MKVENDKVVTLQYKAMDNGSGEVLESNFDSRPLEFIYGKNNIITGLKEGIDGMSVGEMREFVVPSDKAYGSYNENNIKEYPIDEFEGIELRKGMTLMSIDDNNKKVYVKVSGFDDEKVKIDFNHPLSGKDLKFNVEVIDIREASEHELESGHVHREKQGGCGCGNGCGCH